jgi:hypothetical protein
MDCCEGRRRTGLGRGVITADQFHEGGFGEHIESLVSEDSGASWQQYRTVEPDNVGTY